MKLTKIALSIMLLSSAQIICAEDAQDNAAQFENAALSSAPAQDGVPQEGLSDDQQEDPQNKISFFNKAKGTLGLAVSISSLINAGYYIKTGKELLMSDRDEKLQAFWFCLSNILLSGFISVKAFECAQKSFTKKRV